MEAWSALCVEEHAYLPHGAHEHRGRLGGWPGLALLPWSYSPFWNAVGRNLVGLLESPEEKKDRKQHGKGHSSLEQAQFLALEGHHVAFVKCWG